MNRAYEAETNAHFKHSHVCLVLIDEKSYTQTFIRRQHFCCIIRLQNEAVPAVQHNSEPLRYTRVFSSIIRRKINNWTSYTPTQKVAEGNDNQQFTHLKISDMIPSATHVSVEILWFNTSAS